MSSDGIHVTASADTTGGFIDTTADIGAEVTLTGGYTHIAIGMRTNAKNIIALLPSMLMWLLFFLVF